MSELTEEQIIEKHNKGEELTPEEEKVIMGQTHEAGFEADDGVEDTEFNEDGTKKAEKSEPAKEDDEAKKKDEEDAAAKKKEDDDAAAKAEKEKSEKKPPEPVKEGDVDLDKIEKELEKQEGLEDLSKITVREKGLY